MVAVNEPSDGELDERDDNVGSLVENHELVGGAPAQWGPAGPDGAPMMVIEPGSELAPPFDASHCPCLRGPCRHLHQVWTHFDHGNAVGSLGQQPRQRRITCTAQYGVFLEMSADAPVLECNRWDPDDRFERLMESRRQRYYALHPEHDPAQQQAALEQDQGEDDGNGATG